MELVKLDRERNIVFFKHNDQLYKARIVSNAQNPSLMQFYLFNTNQIVAIHPSTKKESASKNEIVSPISGRVVKIHADKDQLVKKDQPLVTIESMKMENEIRAPFDLFVKSISIASTDLVKQDQLLLEVKGKEQSDDATNQEAHDEEKIQDRRACPGTTS